MNNLKVNIKKQSFLVLIVMLVGLFSATIGTNRAQAEAYADPAFYRVWQRTDKPVADGRTARSWLWAPDPFTAGLQENYQQAPGGKRLVQYYDKSRMEINNPAGDKTNPFYVTNGLLVNELMSGQLQTGDNRFETKQPVGRGVAGDDDDTSGPSYAAMGKNTARSTTNSRLANINRTLDRNGTVGTDNSYTKYGVADVNFVPDTGHWIGSVFYDFLNISGVVYDSKDNPDTQRIFEPLFYATGFPVTEAFWAKVKVAGQVKDVLVQAFERRVLTYTPSNPEGFKVEMGNVGRHYYQWRYSTTPPPTTVPPTTNPFGAIPNGLKSTFMLGLGNDPGHYDWMGQSGAKWDVRYQYLAGDVNGSNWAKWNQPDGAFASYYLDDSAAGGYIPVLTLYTMLQSTPPEYDDLSEGEKNMANLNTASVTRGYFANYKLLLDEVKEFGKPVIIHLEPDLWGFAQNITREKFNSDDPALVPAKVKSSGYGDVTNNYADNLPGFAQALIALRNKYAPNAILGLHLSVWGSTADVGGSTDPNLDVSLAANRTINFTKGLNARFDLLFFDVSDRDAGFYAQYDTQYSKHWWDLTNQTFPNPNRVRDFIGQITRGMAMRAILWQVPIGNTLYRTENNTPGHYQDNRVQYFLGDNYKAVLQDWIDKTGLIGIFFGSGAGEQSVPYDDMEDGITNPPAINGNNLVSVYPDDDGGYLRLRAIEYYKNGALKLP